MAITSKVHSPSSLGEGSSRRVASGVLIERTADLSTTLRSGRDDNSVVLARFRISRGNYDSFLATEANLLKPSAIKPVFATLEQNLIIKRLGVLDPSDQAALRQAIATVLG
jgi:hypothetical protein